LKAPGLMALLVSHWQPSWTLMAEGGLAALLYGWATRRVSGRWPRWRTVSFMGGIACLLVALQSGLDAFDDRLLSVHMVQHLLLLEVAPLMLVGGRPTLLALRAATPRPRSQLARALARLRAITTPLWCLAIFAVVVLLTHLPVFYDATLQSAPLHDAEHALYLSAGLLLWWPLVDGDPSPRVRLDGLGKLIYLIVALMPMALLGAYLNRHSSLVYSAYAGPAHTLGVSAVADQQRAGALMWVAGAVVMVAAGLWQAMATMVVEERRQKARDERFGVPAPVPGPRERSTVR
jgi:putative membrane protein